jgi:hypothetical protein
LRSIGREGQQYDGLDRGGLGFPRKIEGPLQRRGCTIFQATRAAQPCGICPGSVCIADLPRTTCVSRAFSPRMRSSSAGLQPDNASFEHSGVDVLFHGGLVHQESKKFTTNIGWQRGYVVLFPSELRWYEPASVTDEDDETQATAPPCQPTGPPAIAKSGGLRSRRLLPPAA